jgi:hypothetical protein
MHGEQGDRHGDQRQQRDAQLRQQRAHRHGRIARPLERAEKGRQRARAVLLRNFPDGWRQRHLAFRIGQWRRPVRAQLGHDDDVQHVQAGQHQAGEEGARVELHHRHAGGRAIDDEHDRRRDQDAQTAARRDDPGRQTYVVAGAQHGRQCQQAHQRDHRTDDAGGRGEDGAGHQRGDGQRTRQPCHGQMQALEQLLDQVGALDQIAHEHEQGNRNEHVVGHDRKRALHHQVERLLRGDVRVLRTVGQPGEQHAHAHQREGGRKAEHDGHHDQRQHQQAEMSCGPFRRCRHQDGSGHDDDRHQAEAEAEFLSHFVLPAASPSGRSACTMWRSFSTSTSSTSWVREGHWPCWMQTMQRRISTTPCSISTPPASGMMALNG